MDSNLIGQQIPIAVITAYVIEWLKRQPWFPFATLRPAWINRVTSAFAALITAGAINYTFGHNGDFTISGNVWTVLHGLWAATQQYALQHVVYKIAIAPPATPLLVAAEPPHPIVVAEAPPVVPSDKKETI